MLSIIISTYKSQNFTAIKKNINVTIGETKYEVIKIFNPGEMDLSIAYNKGAALAKFENLLFLHDDVQIFTKDWGRILINTLKLEDSGVVGLAGGNKKFKLPTGHDLGIEKYKFVFVSHSEKEEIRKKSITEPVKVKTLDGVFLALRKERWQQFKFNEEIDGFHFYDLDISLRVSEKYQNYIIPNIFLHHFSMGNFNNDWIKASLRFHEGNYKFDNINIKEKALVRKFWFRRLLKEDISFKNRIKYFVVMGADRKSRKEAINFIFGSIIKRNN